MASELDKDGTRTQRGAAEPQLEGVLVRGAQRIPVAVAFASRLSVWVTFQSGDEFADQTVFEKLLVTLRSGEVELTTARLCREYTRQGGAGRLVFEDDVYDCKALFFENKLVNLKGFFQNLPLVLSQRERVKPEFREYVANSMYDLSVWKRFLNEQDRIFANEPSAVAESGQLAVLKTEGRNFLRFFDGQLDGLAQLVKDYDKEEHERHGFYLRRHAWEYILGSEFLKRTNLKPRGYAGDAEMMQMLYENRYVGNYVFNKLLHKHPVETPAAQAVRNRRRLIPRVLRQVQSRFEDGGPGSFRFLSLASGPAWELQDLFLDENDFERFSCTLLDQDPFALAAAKESIGKIEAARDIRIRVRYLDQSVRTMLRAPNLKEDFGTHQFIYSMGLFDYLSPPTARAVLEKVYELLEPGGSLLVGNYHVGTPTRFYMAYWMDWVLYYRTEGEMLELAESLPGATPRVSYDESGCQMFLQVDKPG